MSLKSAAFLALIGMILVSILLVVGLINDILGVAQGIIAAVKLLSSLIYTFAGLMVTLFFYAFHRAQAR